MSETLIIVIIAVLGVLALAGLVLSSRNQAAAATRAEAALQLRQENRLTEARTAYTTLQKSGNENATSALNAALAGGLKGSTSNDVDLSPAGTVGASSRASFRTP